MDRDERLGDGRASGIRARVMPQRHDREEATMPTAMKTHSTSEP